jgi:uncharacterized protein HemY
MARVEMTTEDPNLLKVRMRIELTLGEWRQVLENLEGIDYMPIFDMRMAIRECIEVFDRKYNSFIQKGEHV